MPRSRSRSLESITRSATRWFSRNAPDCCSRRSTSVVLPWSTWAMMAMFLSFMAVQAFDAARIGQGGRRPRLPSMADMTGVRRDASPRRRVADLCGAIHENPPKGKGGGLPLRPPRFQRKSAPEITGILDVAQVKSAPPSRSVPMPPVPSLAAATDSTASARREADAGRRFGRGGLALGAVAAIELAAIAAQVHFGAVGDVSWMITICEKWLDGG